MLLVLVREAVYFDQRVLRLVDFCGVFSSKPEPFPKCFRQTSHSIPNQDQYKYTNDLLMRSRVRLSVRLRLVLVSASLSLTCFVKCLRDEGDE